MIPKRIIKKVLPLSILLLGFVPLCPAPAFSQLTPALPVLGSTIPKYSDALPTFVGARVDGTQPLTVSMEEFQQPVLPASFYAALPAPYNAGTYVWGYNINGTWRNYPAFSIEAQRGTPTTILYANNLFRPDPLDPANELPPLLQSLITVDQTIHWADPLMQMGNMLPYAGPAPAVVHLHGGEVPSAFDGGPDAWFTHSGIYGPGFVSNMFTYPNTQEAATLWFHDHTLGATRLNVYAGLAGFYFLRDTNDTGQPGNTPNLPVGNYEMEIAIQDRMFDANGQLYFPALGINPEHPYWLPEFFGDVIVVNGKSWPYLNVEPRRYRFHFLDGSNARFYDLSLDTGLATRPFFYQIGTDGGLLDAPVLMKSLLMAPGERSDVIIDFTNFPGQTITLRNNAKAPFPNGAKADPKTVGQIMQFRVVLPLTGTDTTANPALGAALRPTPMVKLTTGGVPPASFDQKRQLTLNEVMGMPQGIYPGGPLEILVNNSKWMAAVSETPRVGATEVWEIINLTADAHPIHLHLTQFQLINRQNFQVKKYQQAYDAAFPGGGLDPMTGLPYPAGVYMPAYGPPLAYNTANADGALGGNPAIGPFLQGPIRLPEPNENGWKDTVIMYPGQVSRIAVRFAPTDLAAGSTTAGTNNYSFDPTAGLGQIDAFGFPGGPGYVWHCHIVDHEDNEMMRPMIIAP